MEVAGPPEDAEREFAATESELVGYPNYGAPEIGLIAWNSVFNNIQQDRRACTATAIAPYVVLTAGHCIDDANFFYTIEENPLRVRQFRVRERWRHPIWDIAVVRLWDRVPWWRPIKENGPVGAVAAVWGFGGNDCYPAEGGGWARNEGLWTKRFGFFTTQANGRIDQPIICGGDSGGPVIDWNDGQIFGVVFESTGTVPNGFGTFAATNLPGVWQELMFRLWVWANP
jgi:hypothetical protein